MSEPAFYVEGDGGEVRPVTREEWLADLTGRPLYERRGDGWWLAVYFAGHANSDLTRYPTASGMECDPNEGGWLYEMMGVSPLGRLFTTSFRTKEEAVARCKKLEAKWTTT